MSECVAESVFDFRFAWRWLLPLQGCRKVLLQGFDDAETLFWQDALAPCELVYEGKDADAWIVDADNYVLSNVPNAKVFEKAQTACVVGSSQKVGRWRKALRGVFPRLREYGLIPNRQTRLVVPLDTLQHATTALQLHRPGRRFARLVVLGAKVMASVGFFPPLRRRLLFVAMRESDAMPIGAVKANVCALLPEPNLNFAMYLGTEDVNRKTVVLPLGASDPRTILKVGISPKARQSLKGEADALKSLWDMPIAHNVPKLVGLVESCEMLTLFQEYRVRRPASKRTFDEAVVGFLARLSNINRRSRPLINVLEEIVPNNFDFNRFKETKVLHAVWRRLHFLADAGMMVWEHRSHGDFAPWNCSWTEQGLFVFDWEESQTQDLALSDAFYYVVAPALYVAREPDPVRTVQNALNFALRVAFDGEFKEADLKVYLALWILQHFDKSPIMNSMLQVHFQAWR
jgi:hypothetical protein